MAYPPWPDRFPVSLSEWGRDSMLRPIGLDLETYGTARMMGGGADGPREVVASLDVPRGGRIGRVLVEVLPRESVKALADVGLRFAKPDVVCSDGVLRTLRTAVDRYLVRMPGLSASVASLARCLHVLQVDDDDYDTSHSDPELPFSIFISVPDWRRPAAPLRVAESLVHETMHLQLSLVERARPLFAPSVPATRSYSPWRGTDRDASGVLHALYVFRVIERFWSAVAEETAEPTTVRFASSRREQIESQIREVTDFRLCPTLTPAGKALVDLLLDGPRC
jgi:hypothetical protein